MVQMLSVLFMQELHSVCGARAKQLSPEARQQLAEAPLCSVLFSMLQVP